MCGLIMSGRKRTLDNMIPPERQKRSGCTTSYFGRSTFSVQGTKTGSGPNAKRKSGFQPRVGSLLGSSEEPEKEVECERWKSGKLRLQREKKGDCAATAIEYLKEAQGRREGSRRLGIGS